MNEQFKKRLLSFLWRLGAYIVVAVLAFVVENLTDLGVSPSIVAVIALIAGEITKYLNKRFLLGVKLGLMIKK